MGGFTGFLSGLTLTAGAAYVGLAAHQRNRIRQAAAVRQQTLVLNSLLEPDLVPVEARPQFSAARPSWSETWKDRWNAEIESAVRRVQAIDWDDVRAGAEGSIRAWLEGGRKA